MGRSIGKKDEILVLLGQGKSYPEIARIIGCVKSTVAYHAAKAGARRSRERYDWQAVQDFIDHGHTRSECLSEFNMPDGTFYYAATTGRISFSLPGMRPNLWNMDTPEGKAEYARIWMHGRRASRRAAWLGDKSCAVCGTQEFLEVDHIDPSTKESNNMWLWNPIRRAAELEKCQVLCYRHHKEKTTRDHIAKRKHGTEAMYRGGECRCDICCEGMRSIRRERKARARIRTMA